MDWKYLLLGVGFLLVAYLIYQRLKKGPASDKTDWNGPTLSLYVQGWGAFIICLISGIVFILKSLPSQI